LDFENKTFEENAEIVKTAIKEDMWSKNIEHIKEAKKYILDELNIFSVISKHV